MLKNMALISTFRFFPKNQFVIFYFQRNIKTQRKLNCKDNTDGSQSKNKSDRYSENKKDLPSKEIEKARSNETTSSKLSKDAAKKKLLSLLSEIKVSPDSSQIKTNLNLAKPLKRQSKAERLKNLQEENSSPDKDIKKAVAAVAKSVTRDAEKVEKELKEKLSSINLIQDTSQKYIPSTNELEIDEKLQEDMMASVKDIASTVPTSVKSKLTQRLLKMSVESKENMQSKISIENMMKGIKIEKHKGPAVTPKIVSPEVSMKEKKPPHSRGTHTRINIFQSPPLDIFSSEEAEIHEGTNNEMWKNLEKKQLKLLTEFAPANAFEEMIMWTEQGKHWKFPIDNEIEIGDEENVGFHEHVFLDQHLQGFPTKGPIRHFMELVVVGLSKNPYISVDRKIENINWFRDYFKEKEDILKEYGAI